MDCNRRKLASFFFDSALYHLLGKLSCITKENTLDFLKNLLTSDVICSALRYGGPCRIRCIHPPSESSAALGGEGENLILT